MKDGTIGLDASVTAQVNDPNADGRVTLAELQGTPFSSLVDISANSQFDKTLPVFAQVGGTALGAGAKIAVSDANLFDANLPSLELQGFEELAGFEAISANSLLNALTTITSSMKSLSNPARAQRKNPVYGRRHVRRCCGLRGRLDPVVARACTVVPGPGFTWLYDHPRVCGTCPRGERRFLFRG
ncbi:MAG: hypothetical protein ACI8PT_000817 [Gammaproteobacteria bacterium]